MLNSYYGIYQAIVTNINDPEKRGRIKVQCPSVLGVRTESAWCDPCVPVAYDDGGDFCLPQLREAVWVMFISGDVNKPVYLGGWWSKNKTPLGDSYTNLDDTRVIGYNGSSVVMGDNSLDLRARTVKINGVPYSSGGDSSEVLTAISELKEEVLAEIVDTGDNVLSEISDFKEEFETCCAGMQESLERVKQELIIEINKLTPPEPVIIYKNGSVSGQKVYIYSGAVPQSYAGFLSREV